MAITKKKNKEGENQRAPERSCPHDYPPQARRDKNHFLPPRTAHDVFHALFLLQAKLPREVAVRVLDWAGFWIWDAVECRCLMASDREISRGGGRHMFISNDKLRERKYARMRRFVFGLELKSYDSKDDSDLAEAPGWRFSFEAMLEPLGRTLRAGVTDMKDDEPRLQLFKKTRENGGGPISRWKQPIMHDLEVSMLDERLDYTWTASSSGYSQTGYCAHILYALV